MNVSRPKMIEVREVQTYDEQVRLRAELVALRLASDKDALVKWFQAQIAALHRDTFER